MIEQTRSLPWLRAPILAPGPDAFARLEKALAGLTPLPPEERLDALLRDQAARWGAGEPIGAEFYRRAAPSLVDDDSLLYLVSGEMRLRGEAGEKLDMPEYRSRFPEHADTLQRQIEVESALRTEDLSGSLPDRSTITFERQVPRQEGVPAVPGFEILEELGRGGMGVVYKARQVGLNRLVALKTILPGKGASATVRERFQREAQHIAQLKHPNIVPVFAFGEHDGQTYFALEFIAGGSLAAKLHGHKPWAAREAARFAAALAGAMAYAHDKDIIHRDLKPANILIGDDGQPLITDFGLARQAASAGLTLEGAVVGTPAYMSPEQAKGDTGRIGPAADVFGLGAILYQLLTGRPPYSGTDVRTTLREAEQGQVLPVREANPAVPKTLARIVDLALEPDLKKRYATARDLERALRAWLDPLPRRLLVGLGAAAALLLAAGAALAWGPLSKVPEQASATPAHPKDLEPPKAVPMGPPLTADLKVTFWSKEDRDRHNRSVTEKGVLPILTGELIQIQVSMNKPAYAYLVWIGGDGAIDPMHPWERKPEAFRKPAPKGEPVVRFQIPEAEDQGLPLEGESGLETAMLMARETPLPSDVLLGDLLGKLAPSPLGDEGEAAERALVRGQEIKPVDLNRKRGLGMTPEQIDAPVLTLMRKVSKHFEVVRIVRFAYKQRKRP